MSRLQLPLGIPIRFRCYTSGDGPVIVMITIIIYRILNLRHTTIVLITILKMMSGIRVTITVIISDIATIIAVIVIKFVSMNILSLLVVLLL